MGILYNPDVDPLCFGAKVSPYFRSYVRDMGGRLGIDPNYLMACIAFETGRTFSAKIRNAAGSGAVGLIQFMPQTAQALGTSVEALAAMSEVQQLAYVEKYFRPQKGKLKTLSDVYMAILWPGAIGKPENFVLFRESDKNHPKRYIQNRGLDWNDDGVITKAEASASVLRLYRTGLRPENSDVETG